MNLQELLKQYAAHPNVSALDQLLLDESSRNIFLKGLAGSGAATAIAALFSRSGGSYVCILNDQEDAGYFYHDLVQLTGGGKICFFPSGYRRSIKYGHTDPANEILRTEVLSMLQDPSASYIIVTYPEALAEKVIAKDILKENTLKIHKGERLDNMFVSDILDEYGFEHTDYVYEPGQYAMRGSILDVFSFSYEFPYRIDFFGDEVETIRSFDVETQLSKERFDSIHIVPRMGKKARAEASLLDSVSSHAIIAARDLAWCKERINTLWDEEPVQGDEESFRNIDHKREKLVTAEGFLRQALDFRRIHFGTRPSGTADATITFQTTPQPIYHKNFDLVSESLRNYLSEGYTLYILSDSEKQTERIRTIFEDRGDDIPFTAVGKTIHEGFSDAGIKACFFTDHQLFDRFHKFSLKSDKARSGKITLSLKELNQFSNGDYIVHVDHGVGQFGGLVRTEANGKIQEVVKLIFLNNDVIFVSIHSLHKLSRYKGKDSGEPPKLSKLGTGAWERMKERTKKKVKDIARDLILLYSKRRQETGFAYSPDSFMQHELEASFIYEDTPDQMKATADVKMDMEDTRPMDRLICGDVGFGKTEVAMRAAFKAVADNKQVAVLVPTTVLAFQHYQSFRDRLKDFPCRIDYISRARSAAQIKAVLEDVKEGKVNILIGTHRIVSKDVKFKDLGLLIIDEEQKFGVSVKEKLRQMKVNVDTLTMTATPIPRTLQFSLMGARDLSNINTPPPNRYPVRSEVERFNPDIIRDAIEFEMSRNGQVFFINNRIQNIHEIEALIKREVPDARVCVGHGQMEPEKLEKILLDFINYEYDVLVATSIVENGIDVSNANTIIVNNAHQFGLSDLHQLRGRVGRSNRKAFCYLLSPPLSTLTQEARRRLQAIENFSELGSGIHIAMQDLDIRGAGNLLGAEQSGFIADLGYETYQKILEEAVDELKNEEFAELYEGTEAARHHSGEDFVRETHIESDLELMFPPVYIPSDSERVSLYRELDKMEEELDILAFSDRLKDRFGSIPKEGKELIRVVRLRRLARSLGIEKAVLKQGRMSLFFVSNPHSPYYESDIFGKILSYISCYPRRCELRENNNKRSLLIKDVPTIEDACSILEEMG
ncbi:transcription-repair coupling factor (superfamily II helicase) [Parabacteroides sp. PF5-5]|uniref:transcription-repair coupling factor n=1 Tax=unclassified Parabacteroides TaxID=2649774 RepID=UPI002474C8EA|nr:MULTISPECIES: transcription-repair coupling factor [unclassified Parabacteroides]MDH6305152.1 transcription-repair coupling factor (superfamily II helicase) [Parabacteroides sp. PH5-39]MDH6316502.1 transcription-repair coupling factor (superfamily II helicase) [Parabacteroides sp. PF5-13]MDH6320012.1 transcription-repair coupling factor (superfamily II helicase) [Parabacteroides sp. PH5-13]MDH6323755.1 transcription-repair coupling factor (superfamily II helicase) [Parabacteroides sp. PH5-8]